MKLIDLNQEDPFEVTPGCPTLSFDAKGKQMMVPYHLFKFGTYSPNIIVLTFTSGRLMINGKNLHGLWRHLQLQDVRCLYIRKDLNPSDPCITEMSWVEDEPESA